MKNHDFLIIGAGIFGLTAAISLKKKQYSVAVLNPDSIPHPLAASTDISKIVRMEYGSDFFYMQMGNAAIDKWYEWNDFFQKNLYHEVGWLLACKKPLESAAQAFERHSYENLIRLGQKPERLKSEEVRKRFPVFQHANYEEAIFHQKAGFAEASETVRTLASYARELKVEVFEGHSAIELIVEGNMLKGVKTQKGTSFFAGHIVVCAGPYTPYLIRELMPFTRATGHPVFHIKPSKPALFSTPNLPVFSADTSNTGWYGFPLHPKEKVLKIANHGVGLNVHPEKDQRIVTKQEIFEFRTFLKETIPSIAEDPIVFTRKCVYADTLDGDFWIDKHPELQGLTIATGGSGHGFKFAPILGDVIAAAALDEENPWLSRFKWRMLPEDTRAKEEARNTG